MNVLINVVAGLGAAAAFPAAVALLAACDRMEVSTRALVALAMIVACAWCVAHALHGRSTGPEALLMSLAALQSLSMLRGRRILRRVTDLFPFGGAHEPITRPRDSEERPHFSVVGRGVRGGVRGSASGVRVRAGAGDGGAG